MKIMIILNGLFYDCSKILISVLSDVWETLYILHINLYLLIMKLNKYCYKTFSHILHYKIT